MAGKHIEQFIDTYGPVAQQVSKELKIDPNLLLSQWGSESNWGRSEMAKKYHNLGAIKDFSGFGHEAKDNKTGSIDKYVKFEDPEVFGMYYADQIKRNFPKAMNSGPDAGAFARGLAAGKNGSYFEVPVQEYEISLNNAQKAIPENKMLSFDLGEPQKEQAQPETPADGDMVAVPKPPEPPPEKDLSGADRASRFLFGGPGAVAGVAAAGLPAAINAHDNRAVNLAAKIERAKIAEQRAAGAVPAASGAVSAPSAQPPTLGATSPLQATDNQATRILQGTTGDEGTTGRARQQGYNEQTSQQSAQRKEMDRRIAQLRQSGVVADDAPAIFAKNPGMTSTASGVVYPRSEPAPTLGPRTYGPPSIQTQAAQSGALPIGQTAPYQIGGTKPIPTTTPFSPKAASGLEWITEKLARMAEPVVRPIAKVAKYAAGPLGGLTAGLDLAEFAHEYRKPDDSRDTTKMGLNAASGVGGVLSMFPNTAPVGIPLSLGASGLQYLRENPDVLEKMMRRVGESMPSDPMGYNP